MRMSVVVTIVDGGAALDRCLDALAAQAGVPSLEVLVPHDDSVPDPSALRARHHAVRFLAIGHLPTLHSADTPAGQHELYDRRKAAGMAAASGDLVALLEDRCVPRSDWAATAIQLHGSLPHAVIGGAVENACDAVLNWAVFFCDFGRYVPPFPVGPRRYVTNVNVCYKRVALESSRHLWVDRYSETTVHWYLAGAGETLYADPAMVVAQWRGPLRLLALLRERVAFGRLFAHTRSRRLSAPARAGLLALTPVLPAVLLARHLRDQMRDGHPRGRFLRAVAPMTLLLLAWSLGEGIGYATGTP